MAVRIENPNDALDAAIDMASAADTALKTTHKPVDDDNPLHADARQHIQNAKNELSKAREITGRMLRG